MTGQKTIVKTTVFDPVEKVHKTVRLSISMKMPEIAAQLAVRALKNKSNRSELMHGLIEAKILPGDGDTIRPRAKYIRP